MLFHLSNHLIDSHFKKLIKSIMTTYWPKKAYDARKDKLPEWNFTLDPKNRLEQIRNKLVQISEEVSSEEKLYVLYHPDIDASKEQLGFPFMERFHQYFLQRQWEYPYKDPKANYENLFRLDKPAPEEEDKIEAKTKAYVNYSRNYGDFNHFVNVVAATARLIEHFSKTENTVEIFDQIEIDEKKRQHLAAQLSFKPSSIRSFKLLLAAFYHDIGKTVEIHRHGMEGANIFANHTTRAVYQLQRIVEAYRKKTPGINLHFEKEDLLFISHLIYYHDQFGTLGTGESSYLRLADLIHRFRRYTISDNIEKQQEGSRCCLFDLWVLNIADIMVSLEKKYVLQKDLWSRKRAEKRIKKFFSQPPAEALKHDLRATLRFLDRHNESLHNDDLSVLEEDALNYAKQHAVERIRRLLRSLLSDHLKEFRDKFGPWSPSYRIVRLISRFSESKWNTIISRSIYSLGDYAEFTKRFCWIGQMDYAFGFFKKIAERALEHVNNEIETLYQIKGKNSDGSNQTYSGDMIFAGPLLLGVPNIANAPLLIEKLQRESSTNLVSQFIWENIDNKEKKRTEKQLKLADPHIGLQERKYLLVRTLNKIIKNKEFYAEERFAGVILRPETEELIKQYPTDNRMRLNRLLIEDAFPDDIVKSPPNYPCTGWVYKTHDWSLEVDPKDCFWLRTNAEFFADNFTSTIVQILQHLVFREEEIERLRNLEFWVATQRLTKEKIDRIISLEGPSRTRLAVQLALESIYLW